LRIGTSHPGPPARSGTTSSGAPPIVVNAIIDALRPFRVIDMPATPLWVWQAIKRVGGGKARKRV
jgi:hypothetical protein